MEGRLFLRCTGLEFSLAHSTSHRKTGGRAVLVLAAVFAAAALGACATGGRDSHGPLDAAAMRLEAPVMGTEPVSKGVYLAIDRRLPLEGQALTRANLDRRAAVAAIRAKVETSEPSATQPSIAAETQPSASPTQAPADALQSQAQAPADKSAIPGEPPPLAVKDYLRGRSLFLEGKNSDALDALEQALSLDPNAFTVLRLMGRVSFANSQLARGAMFLERAHTMRPGDVEVNYLLGRYWLERNDNERAAFYLAQAEDSPEVQITSTQTPLSAFYLGIAFQQAGYHLAAARELEHFLELAARPIPGYRYDTEMSYLLSVEWATHLSIAENFVRIGDFKEALAHYQAAAADQPQDAFVVSRLVNAQVHLALGEAARKRALEFLGATSGSDDAIKLLVWAYRAFGREAAIVGDVAAYLKANSPAKDDGEQAALILAATQDHLGQGAGALATLGDYLSGHPTDLKVLERELQHAGTAAEFRTTLNAAAAAIHADEKLTDNVVKLFAPVAQGAAGAAFLKVAQSAAGAPAPALAEGFFLEGITARAHHAPPAVVESMLRQAVEGSPHYFPARAELVSFLVSREEFSAAAPLIDQAIEQNLGGAKAWLLRVQTEAAQDRLTHALELAQEACQKFPTDIPLRMEVAAIYRQRGQDSLADAQLQDIISDAPTYEPAYAALVNAWFLRTRQGENPSAGLPVVINALNKLLREVPSSRFGQETGAVLFARDGRVDEAQNVLQALLVSDPDDPVALVRLAQVRQLAGKASDAQTLLENALERKSQPEVAQELASIYRGENRQADALDMLRKLAVAHPDSADFALAYARELTAQGKVPDAVAVLSVALQRMGHSETLALALADMQMQAGDAKAAVKTWQDFMKTDGETSGRLYTLTRFTSGAEMDDASVAALQRVLSIMPDHIGANNDLGYFWADAGIHLDQAEPMIKKALDNRPGDPAFMDSLGWVYYKQGKFEQARAEFETAIGLPGGAQPEVIQHLGDTLYRLGRAGEAQERWRQAQQGLLDSASAPADPNNKRVLDYLTKAIDDVTAGRQPTLSPLAQPDPPRAAGPATMPATSPQ